jgi:hypothetical protein
MTRQNSCKSIEKLVVLYQIYRKVGMLGMLGMLGNEEFGIQGSRVVELAFFLLLG